MDPGIGHEIESDLQAHGYPILWGQYLPIDPDLMDWMIGREVRVGRIRSPFDIVDVWTFVLQQQYQRDSLGGEVRRADAMDHLRGAANQL
jgi:predicted nucleotide-binding protein (sugar kinase/HSP70/actin superfamily)